MTGPEQRTPGWRAAEQRVSSLYRSFGYTVTTDVLIKGSQIDAVAEQDIAALGTVRIGVEVKDHPNGSLPIAEVREFAATAQILTADGGLDQMHLVTTGTITKNSRELIENVPRARLLTYEELERDLFKPDSELGRWLAQYRSRPINRQYVEIRATLLDVDTTGTDPDATGRLGSTQLLDVAAANPQLGIVVLADYGAGKSTMMDRIKAMAVERRTADPAALIPVLIRLRDIDADFDAEQVVLQAVRSEFGLDLSSASFWNLFRSGRFVMLLDGFDEITLQASEATREQMLSSISPLLFGPSPAILTSRPSYFASIDEYRKLLKSMRAGRPAVSGSPSKRRIDQLVSTLTDQFRDDGPAAALDPQVATYRLDPLSSDQIDEFLEHVEADLVGAGTTPQELRAFLDGVYDLSDLISRPIILGMAVGATVDGHINPRHGTLAEGPAGLYEAYALVQLERDWGKVGNRRQLVPFEARMRFAEECALVMHATNALRIDRDQIPAVAESAYPAARTGDLDAILTDLRTCSFLTVDDRGNLEFIHRSYQEFFVARRIRHDLENGSSARLRVPLQWQYAYFLGSMGFTDNDLYRRFTEFSRTRTPGRKDAQATAVADNAAQAVLVARDSARDLEWRDRHVAGLKRPRVQISRSTLQRVHLLKLEVGELELNDSELDIGVEGGALGTLTVTNCTGTVTPSGTIASIEANGGSLDVNDRSSATALGFDSLDLTLRAQGDKAVRLHTVNGSASLGTPTIDLTNSDLALSATGTIAGAANDSLLDITLTTWDGLAAQLDQTVVVVRGRRATRSEATKSKRPRKVTEDSLAGSGSVIVVDPSVAVDRWWPRQNGLITIGAHLPEPHTDLAGVFVHERPRTKGSDKTDVLEVHRTDSGAIVVDGRGPQFNTARTRLSDTIETARPGAVRDGTWITGPLRRWLETVGCTGDEAADLAAAIRTSLAPGS